MTSPTCRELLEQIQAEVVLPQQILAARVEKVLALHSSRPWGLKGEMVCAECRYGDDEDQWVEWPCPTVRLLDGEEL